MSRPTLSLGSLVLAGGGLTAALALGWWWLTFGTLTQASTLSLSEAGNCLVQGSSLCSLAAAICTSRHAFLLVPYNAAAFWASLAVLAGGVVLQARPGAGKP